MSPSHRRSFLVVSALLGAACSVVNAVEEPLPTGPTGSGAQAGELPAGGDGGQGLTQGGHGGEGLALGGGAAGGSGGSGGSGGEGGQSDDCGDGLVDVGEQCDDENATPSDGCTGCEIDLGYDCIGEPSSCTPICGDGLVRGSEGCDDDNDTPSDGCTGCQIDEGYDCDGEPSTCCRPPLVPCAGSCVDTLNDPDHCGGCGATPCDAGQICAAGSCGAGCLGGASLLSVAPSQTMALCDHPSDTVCEQDFETLCPTGWQLCSYLQFAARQAAWSFNIAGNHALGEIYCRGASADAGHFTVPDATNPTTLLSEPLPFNCYYGSSRPECTAWYGCNEQSSYALCCAPTPTCGNGSVEGVEEQCDDGNALDGDDCLNSCSYRWPGSHGITGTNCP